MAVDEAALDAFLASDGEATTSEPTGSDAAATAAAAAQSAPATQEPVAQADVAHDIPDLDPNQDSFDRAYVEKLRRESANYRDRAKKYNEAFEGYEDEAVQEWLSLAAQLRQDPIATAQRFQELAEAIKGNYATDAEKEEAASYLDPETNNQPLTAADVQRMLDEREKEADMQRRVAQVHQDAASLGYQRGTDQYDELLWRASRLPTGSVQDAHEIIKAERQRTIDEYIKSLGSQPNPVVPSGGAPASGEKRLESFEEANEALEAWLAGQV